MDAIIITPTMAVIVFVFAVYVAWSFRRNQRLQRQSADRAQMLTTANMKLAIYEGDLKRFEDGILMRDGEIVRLRDQIARLSRQRAAATHGEVASDVEIDRLLRLLERAVSHIKDDRELELAITSTVYPRSIRQ